MTEADLFTYRLYAQRLISPDLASPEAVVGHLGAVQAQDFGAAKWALGLRANTLTEDIVMQAYNEGRILRTHVLRPTWHFILPADIRWMLRLTAPRVIAASATHYRKCGLTDAVFAKANQIIAEALRDGQYLNRKEINAVLAENGLDNDPFRLSWIVMRAELDGVICSGPARGKQFTYALLEDRVPLAPELTDQQALERLVRRYFVGHGPATFKDFLRWSGLSAVEAKPALEMMRNSLQSERIDSLEYWFDPSLPDQVSSAPIDRPFLLPSFDEYAVAFSNRFRLFSPGYKQFLDARGDPLFNNCILLNGAIAGTWKRTVKKQAVVIEPILFTRFTAIQKRNLDQAFAAYGNYMQLPLQIIETKN